MYIYSCIGLGAGTEIYWRRFTNGSRSFRHGAVIRQNSCSILRPSIRLSSSEHAPSIIFMDEIDSIGSTRVEGSSGGDSEVQRTMLELLNQLDGFEPKQNIK
jgi:ATPase family associated with various cellular activities (AAA)